MSYKASKPGSVYLRIVFLMCCCLLGHFLCIVSSRWYMFCILVVLVKSSVLAKWLARKTPLRKPNRSEGIDSTKPRPKSVYNFLGFNVVSHCFMKSLCCLWSRPYAIYFILIRYDTASLCWKCRWTPTNWLSNSSDVNKTKFLRPRPRPRPEVNKGTWRI